MPSPSESAKLRGKIWYTTASPNQAGASITARGVAVAAGTGVIVGGNVVGGNVVGGNVAVAIAGVAVEDVGVAICMGCAGEGETAGGMGDGAAGAGIPQAARLSINITDARRERRFIRRL